MIRTIGTLEWQKDAPLAAATVTVPIAVRPEPDVEREKPAYGLGSGWDEQFAKGRAKVAAMRAKTPIIACEVQAIRIGPLGIATNGSEYFCEHGLWIKDCSPFDSTWVVSLANEYIGYVPTSQAFVSGGYEPRTAMSSYLAVDAGQKLVEGALKALEEVARRRRRREESGNEFGFRVPLVVLNSPLLRMHDHWSSTTSGTQRCSSVPTSGCKRSGSDDLPSTRNRSALPEPGDLRRLSQSLAMLDAILCPEWQYRYHSFNASWAVRRADGVNARWLPATATSSCSPRQARS